MTYDYSSSSEEEDIGRLSLYPKKSRTKGSVYCALTGLLYELVIGSVTVSQQFVKCDDSCT